MTPDEDQPLTTAEVAEILQVKPKTVNTWARKGLIPHYRTPGEHGLYRFHRHEIDQWMADGGATQTGQ